MAEPPSNPAALQNLVYAPSCLYDREASASIGEISSCPAASVTRAVCLLYFTGEVLTSPLAKALKPCSSVFLSDLVATLFSIYLLSHFSIGYTVEGNKQG